MVKYNFIIPTIIKFDVHFGNKIVLLYPVERITAECKDARAGLFCCRWGEAEVLGNW